MTPATAEEWEIRYRQAIAERDELARRAQELEAFSEVAMRMVARSETRAKKAERALAGRRTKSPTPSGGGPWGADRRDGTSPRHAASADDHVNAAVWTVTITAGAVMGLGLWKLGELIAGVIA